MLNFCHIFVIGHHIHITDLYVADFTPNGIKFTVGMNNQNVKAPTGVYLLRLFNNLNDGLDLMILSKFCCNNPQFLLDIVNRKGILLIYMMSTHNNIFLSFSTIVIGVVQWSPLTHAVLLLGVFPFNDPRFGFISKWLGHFLWGYLKQLW